MMKRKVVSMCLACVAMLYLSVMPVRAQEWSNSIQVSSGFTSAWSRNNTFEFKIDPEVALYLSATYGYSTFPSKKDYIEKVGGTPSGVYGLGQVTNSDGSSADTGWITPGYTSGKVSVDHTGTATYTVMIRY